MKTRTVLTGTAVLLAGVILLGTFSRKPARGQATKPTGVSSAIGGGGGASSGATVGTIGDMSGVEVRRNKFRAAVKKLRTAKDAVEKSKAKTNLTAVLKDLFDNDLAQRQKEIDSIESRVKELRGILAKRRAAQSSIIDLQIKVLVYEAEGLGFPQGRSRGNRNTMFGSSGGAAGVSNFGNRP